MTDFISNYGMEVLATVITTVASFVGMQVKSIYEKYVDTKVKKEVVTSTVAYVEQIYSALDSAEKLEKAKDKTLEWLQEKGVAISDTELEILIESAVNGLVKTNITVEETTEKGEE